MFRFDSFWRQHFFPALAFLALILILGCQGRPQKKEQAAKTGTGVTDLGTRGGDKLTVESLLLEIENHKTKKLLRIRKSALKKEFLLTSARLSGGASPFWWYYQPRIVYFDHKSDKILMNEVNEAAVYDSVKLDILVDSFAVVKEDAQFIVFDLGSGFTQVSYRDLMQDTSSKTVRMRKEGELKTFSLHKSLVKELSQAQETISIEEVGQQREIVEGAQVESTLQFLFRLRPYRDNPNFKVVIADSEERVLHFSTLKAVPARTQTHLEIAYRWDFHPSRGPVEVGISAEFPVEYQEAAVGAINYWNRILGGEKLKIVKDVSSQSPPKERAILVRWVNHVDSDKAFGLMSADPRTGEILSGEVHLGSNWVINDTSVTQDNQKSRTEPAPIPIMLKEMSVCRLELPPLSGFPTERRETMANDVLRWVMAHELGHVLGLRHNFAASLETDLTTPQYQQAIQTYLATGRSVPIGGSVMDYYDVFGRGVVGATIQTNVLPYDLAALRYTLSGGDKSELIPLKTFPCTDGLDHTFKTYGCMTFDSSRNPIFAGVLQAERQRTQIIAMIFDSILTSMLPRGTDFAIPIESILNSYSPAKFDELLTLAIEAPYRKLDSVISLLTYNPEIKAHMQLKSGALYYEALLKNDWRYKDYRSELTSQRMGGDLIEAGGMSRIIMALLPAYETERGLDFNFIGPQIQELLKSERFRSGVATTGRSYQLTSQQQETLRRFFEAKRTLIEERILNNVLNFSPGSKHLYSALLQNGVWYPDLVKTIARILWQPTSEAFTIRVGDKVFNMPVRAVSAKPRADLADFLNNDYMNTTAGTKEITYFVKETMDLIRNPIRALLEAEKPGQEIKMPQGVKAYKAEILRLEDDGKLTKEVATWMRDELAVIDRIE